MCFLKKSILQASYLVIAFIFSILSTAALAESKVLNVAIYLEPPFAMLENNKLTGKNIDLAYLIAKDLNAELNLLQCPFARCMDMVKHGQADIIFGVKRTTDREKNYAFLDQPYRIQHFPLNVYHLKSNQLIIKNYQDLAGLTIGVLRGGTYFDQFDQDNSLNKVAVTTRTQLVDMLLKGRIDVFLERDETIAPILIMNQAIGEINKADYQYDKTVEVHMALSKKTFIYQNRTFLSELIANYLAQGKIQALSNKHSITIKQRKPEH